MAMNAPRDERGRFVEKPRALSENEARLAHNAAQRRWREKNPTYMRVWRDRHPHYNRDWYRELDGVAK